VFYPAASVRDGDAAETTMSAKSPERVPVSVIAANSSPPPRPLLTPPNSPADGRAVFVRGPSHNATPWPGWLSRERPPSIDVGTAAAGGDDGALRRSTSATLSNDATSSSMPQSPHHYGSTYHRVPEVVDAAVMVP